MAIVKILKSSKNFSAVAYNELRVKKGEAKLVLASNFLLPINNSDNYISYFKEWSLKNKRIKYPQLHVVISLKGIQSDVDDLTMIAKEWLLKMGYGNNPYLIYYHTNTNNSHIHIVTTRVGENGEKIDHNFERKKSQRVLNEICGVDKLKEFRLTVSDLIHYSFQTTPQFLELCRDMGIEVNDKGQFFELVKDTYKLSLSKDLVEYCSKRYNHKIDSNLKKSIQAKIFKYAGLLDKEFFVEYMKRSFGLKFVFYGKDNNYYGFNVIDYKNKAIYKGSELFSIKTINNLLFSQNKTYQDKYNLMVKDFLRSNKFSTLSDINVLLLKEGVVSDGLSYYKFPDNELLGHIDKKLSNLIVYNTRVNKILTDYNPQNIEEKKVLSKIYHIPIKDLDRNFSTKINPDDILYYKGIINDVLSNSSNIRQSFEMFGLEFHYFDNCFVLRDASNRMVISNDRLGVDYNAFRNAINSQRIQYDFGQRFDDEYVGVDYDYEPEILLVDILSSFMTTRASGSGRSNKKKKKR